MPIRICAEMTCAADQRAAFNDFVSRASAMVAEKEAGRTLQYEFYAADGEDIRFAVNEAYADMQAMVSHFENLGPLMQVVNDIFSIERLAICGPVAPEMVEQIKGMGAKEIVLYPDQL